MFWKAYTGIAFRGFIHCLVNHGEKNSTVMEKENHINDFFILMTFGGILSIFTFYSTSCTLPLLNPFTVSILKKAGVLASKRSLRLSGRSIRDSVSRGSDDK
jgi:hypothetical protein